MPCLHLCEKVVAAPLYLGLSGVLSAVNMSQILWIPNPRTCSALYTGDVSTLINQSCARGSLICLGRGGGEGRAGNAVSVVCAKKRLSFKHGDRDRLLLQPLRVAAGHLDVFIRSASTGGRDSGPNWGLEVGPPHLCLSPSLPVLQVWVGRAVGACAVGGNLWSL